MKKNVFRILSVCMLCLLCSCDTITNVTIDAPSDVSTDVSPAVSAITLPKPEPKPEFKVDFDENEAFADDISRRAAQIIDPAVQTAVTMLNTLPEPEFDVLDCDYSQRPTERDVYAGEEAVLEWYDFIYENMSALEEFRLDPKDYGGEEAFYFPFYTAESALMVDHREIFLCGATWMDENDGSVYPVYFMPGDWVSNPCDDKEAIRNEAAVYDRIIDRIFEKMPEGLSNYQKLCYFSFVIAAATEYDHDYEDSASVYAPYDTLVRGRTVCRGYSLTLYELCRRAEISCWNCDGMIPSGYHAWNRVETTEGMRWIDLTWYDEEDITDSYTDGDTRYLFMTQEDIEYWEYREGAFE